MNQTATQTVTSKNEPQRLDDVLTRLIEFDSGGLPVVSLYLNAQANQQGRDQTAERDHEPLTNRRLVTDALPAPR